MPNADTGRDAGPGNPDTTPQQADHATRFVAAAADAEQLLVSVDACDHLPGGPDKVRRLARTDPADQVTDTLRRLQATLENPDTTPAAADRATRLLAAAVGCQPDDTPGDPNP
jgi:hypothetical protein